MIKSLTDCYTLTNGVTIPGLGFGTWQTPAGEEAVAAVWEALRIGYRHIDTAAIYGNEESVGQALRESGLPREAVFVTSKLWNDDRGYEETIQAFTCSLQRLGLDYLDLYLIHWPNPAKLRPHYQQPLQESWRAMEDLCRAGKVRAIGVSNFLPHHLAELLKTAQITPQVNQIRLFPGFPQLETVNRCRELGVLVEAYSPLGTGKLLERAQQELQPLAEKYGKSMAQVCLRWSLQKGYVPLPKSVTPARIQENAQVFDFNLADADMAVLDALPNYCGDKMHPDQVAW